MEAVVYERMAATDDRHWWFVARRRIVGALLDRFAPPAGPAPRRVLEVGCGTGANIPLLQRYGLVEALEPNAVARAITTTRTGVAVRGGFLPDGVPLEPGRYDLIALLDVLEHIPDDAGTLRVLHRALAPGGRLLLTVPAMPWLWSAHDEAHHHQRRYTAGVLCQALDAAGWRVVHATHFNTLLLPLIVAARLIGRLTGRAGGDDAMPGAGVNGLLTRIFGLERWWIARLAMPLGVSLAIIAEPAGAPAQAGGGSAR